MSYYCEKCKEQREQGCFGPRCPGIQKHANTDALPPHDRTMRQYGRLVMGNESLVERLYKLGAGGLDEASEAAYEIEKLLMQREAEARRLDWLMLNLNGCVTRRMVGEMNDTSDPAEWRKKLDAAMGPGWPDA